MSERKLENLSEEFGGVDISEMIATRAYEIFDARGREHGRDLEDWLQAEQEVLGSLSGEAIVSPAAKTQLTAKAGGAPSVPRSAATNEVLGSKSGAAPHKRR